jgi:SAM-dependent methyltransferase
MTERSTGVVDNARAWDHWADIGSISSRPVGRLSPAEARAMLDPDGWLPWPRIRRVLCLAGGGGQQAPAFATLGCEVTVVDVSARQLEIDRQLSAERGLKIECRQGDMTRLELDGRHFDLVYQPISSCYVSHVGQLYEGVRRVLVDGGLYRVEHWNPAHMRLWLGRQWGEGGYTLAATGAPADPLVAPVAFGPDGEVLVSSTNFPHSLESLLGRLCDTGFAIRRLAEDCGGDPTAPSGSEERLAAFMPPFFRLLARKLPRVEPIAKPTNGAAP